MGLQASSAPPCSREVPELFSLHPAFVQPWLSQCRALLCSECNSSRVLGSGQDSPGGKQGVPLCTHTCPSSPDGHWTQWGCGCEAVLVLWPHPNPACPTSLQKAAGCTHPVDGPNWAAAARAGEFCSGAGGCPQGWLQGAWGCTWESQRGVLGQPAPVCPAQPFPVSEQTRVEHTQGKCPTLQQHHVQRGRGRGQQQADGGRLRTLLHFGYKCQGVKFAMPAPPSAGDFFSSPMLCCFSESGNASVLFT